MAKFGGYPGMGGNMNQLLRQSVMSSKEGAQIIHLLFAEIGF